ncbi:DUF1800 domain-containing protein [Nocardioides sp. R-C-SC26]|uniref:DUF1800 domain-containing protein n=1 Tax=Nocardioides sp. R-C-SC26 TaxID=2870414 RepID=UPI001E3D2C6E|nr:DUF1800 domain-containing protein [Nocardioides sp. R-C-SC26]
MTSSATTRTAARAGAFVPGTFAATPVPTPSERHLAARFSYGLTPPLVRAVRGNRHRAWFEKQLTPAAIADPWGDEVDRWWPDLSLSPLDLWLRQRKGTRQGWEVMNDYSSWLLAKRLRSSRQVLEVMTAFWENHLHVPVTGDGHFTWRADYGRTIRRHALGRFDQLLAATTVHPAMLTYLNAATSTKDAPNENLGRELLELHTLGAGFYTEDDVKDSARILTGWRVDLNDTWQRLYVPEYHATGTVRVHGFTDANATADGRALTGRYLSYLAHHPDTARHLATKLAKVFIRDEPPAAIVDRLAATYLKNKTAIAPVLRQLVDSTAFRNAVDAKLRDPSEDVVASYRAVQAQVAQPVDSKSATVAMMNQTGALGLRTGSWPRPDGAPIEASAWGSPLRALASLDLHWNLANRSYPTAQIVYREHAAWVPTFPITLRDLVDHLARTVLARRSTVEMLETCCLAIGLPADTVVTGVDHGAVTGMPRLLAALLDSPEHYAR